jgi:hypothetical protein
LLARPEIREAFEKHGQAAAALSLSSAEGEIDVRLRRQRHGLALAPVT